jgi:hypothetical protein
LSITLPHAFPSLCEGIKKPVLIIGAGLSRKLAPTPKELFEERCQAAAVELGCPPDFDYQNPDNEKLYLWAERALECLSSQGKNGTIRQFRSVEYPGGPSWSAQEQSPSLSGAVASSSPMWLGTLIRYQPPGPPRPVSRSETRQPRERRGPACVLVVSGQRSEDE